MTRSILAFLVIAFLVVGCIGLGTTLTAHQDQEPQLQPDTTTFMARKLDAARSIVDGLATENYDTISKAAQDLSLLSHEADWNTIQTERYLHLSSNFRNSSERLRDAANERNLDGSTLAYFEVTLNCVRCHQYLREGLESDEKK